MQTGLANDFTRLYKKYYPKVLSDFRRLTSGSSDINDLAQDVFLKLWKKSIEGHAVTSVEDWLYIVTYNRFIDYTDKKKHANRWKKSVSEMNSKLDTVIEAEYREKLNAVNHALGNMPYKQKIVYQLVKVEGFRIREAAETCQLAEQTVKNHLGRASRSLREVFAELFDLTDRIRA